MPHKTHPDIEKISYIHHTIFHSEPIDIPQRRPHKEIQDEPIDDIYVGSPYSDPDEPHTMKRIYFLKY
jgi:hypothetical protein